jgi:hypothetical protein
MFPTCSKSRIKYILEYAEQALKLFSDNNKLNGFLVFLVHLFIQIASFCLLIFYHIGPLFYSVIFIWIGILLSNIYFRGCILTKIERHLWQTKTWFGPFFLYCDLFHLTSTLLHNLFICKIICIITIIFLRILFQY